MSTGKTDIISEYVFNELISQLYRMNRKYFDEKEHILLGALSEKVESMIKNMPVQIRTELTKSSAKGLRLSFEEWYRKEFPTTCYLKQFEGERNFAERCWKAAQENFNGKI